MPTSPPFENLIAAIDVPAQTDKDVRVIRLTGGAAENPAAILTRAQELDKATGKTETDPVVASLDAPSKSVTLVGSQAALARFQGILAQVQTTAVAVEARTISVSVLKPSEIAPRLASIFKAIRLGQDGPQPEVEPIDELKRLVVRAEPSQHALIEQLVHNLDTVQPAERPPLRILQLRNTDAGNLAQVLQSSFDQRPGEQRNAKPVSIQADIATNTLIVSAHESVYPEIESIVSKLNESQQLTGTEREIRIFPLKVARAEELAQTIDQMYPEPPVPLDPRTRQPRYDLKQPREIVVRADRATNSLIVDAPNKRLSGFEQIVRSLDQQKITENVEVRTYKIRNADPNAVANAIRELAAKGALTLTAPGAASTVPVSVSLEPATRSLIVSGPKEAFEPAEKLITELDAKPEVPATDLKLFPLKQARADRLQPIVQRLLAARLRESQIAAGRNPADEARLLEVSSDAASNTLIVSAPRELIAVAEGVITTLDQQSIASAVEVRVFRLTKGQAATIAPALVQSVNAQNAPGETPATISPEPGSNTVIVVGTSAQLARAAKLIEQMDVAVDPEGLGVRSVALKHARAETLAPVVQTVLTRESALDKLPEWARLQAIARSGPSGGEPAPVRVAADARTNALVVSGPKAMLDLAEQIIGTLDTEAAANAPTEAVRIITLQNADASELAQNLQAVFQDAKSLEPPPVIRVDRSSNSLVVRGTDAQMSQVEAIAGKLDAATLNSSRQLRTIPVDRSKVDAELLARTLKRLLDQQPGSKVEIVPAEELIRRANPDAPPTGDKAPPKKTGSTFPVTAPAFVPVGSPVHAAVIAAVLAWQPEAPAKPGPEPVDNDVTIGVDPATNSLLILGSPRATDRIAAIAAQLQQNLPAEPSAVRIVPMPASADVGSVAQLVNQMIAQIGRAGPQNPGGFTGPVSIATDPAGSSLIIAANQTDFTVIGELIGNVLSLSTTQSLAVKVYPLTSVSAARARQALADFVSPQPVGFQARRVRGLDLTVEPAPGEQPLRVTIDPSLIRITSDPMGASLIVAAPAETMPLIDRFVALIDQSPTDKRLAIRRYPLKNAQANELVPTLQQLFDAQRQGPAANETTAARFIADPRSNALLVTASEPQHADVIRLLETADASTERADLALAIIPLQQASPSTVRSIVESVVIGKDTGKRERIRLSADDASNLFVVRAPKEDIEQIRQIIAQVDTSATGGLPVRSIKLERADANTVAAALTRFFTERASVSSTPGRRAPNRVAVLGDKRSGTLVVAASDDDFEQVQTLAKTFDTPADAQSLQFKVIPLKNARVADLETTLRALTDTLMWERMNTPGAQRGEGERIIIEPNQRTNSLVLMGTSDALVTAERVIATLDQAPSDKAQIVVRAVPIGNADLPAIKSVLEKAMVTPGWRPFRGQDPDAVTVEIDKLGRRLVLVGKADRVTQAETYIKDLDASAARPGQQIESVTLANAKADRAAQTLRQFFTQRAQAQGLPADSVSIIGSPDGNVLILAADPDTLKSLKELVVQIDQPDQGAGRRIEVFAMKNIGVGEAAASLRAMFPAGNSRANEQLIVTPQPSTSSIIVSAPEALLDQVKALVAQLDAPPTTEQANIATVTLASARAADVANALKAALPPNVKVIVTPVTRSNSILLTGSAEAIAIATDQIRKIDTEPVKSLLVFKRIKLTNAAAEDVFFSLRSLLRSRGPSGDQSPINLDYSPNDNTLLVSASTDQVEEVARIVNELDVAPTSTRSTEFVKLQFADASQISKALELFYGRFAPEAATPGARAVTILPDAASNSLVISADQKEWEGLRTLLAKLDTKEYDTSRQLQVIPLRSADAASVARAINEGLRAPLEEQVRQERARLQQNQRARNDQNVPAPAVVLGGEGVPTISAEPQTNALVVFAGRRDMERIEAIVKQLDVPGFANMPAPTIVPLKSGKATQIAATLREMFIGRLPGGQQTGPRAVAILGDDAAGALIVRADESQLAQIKALAESLTQSGENARLMPQVVRLKNVPAARLRATLLATFQPMAQQMGETVAVEVDRGTNSLVIAASPRIFEQITKVIAELDDRGLGAVQNNQDGASIIGQSVTVIDINNNDPEQIKKTLEDMGLAKAQPADRPGVVAEPVTIVTLSSRRAIAVLASPSDGQAVAELVRAIDAAPIEAEQKIQVIPLKLATASTLVRTLDSMISPTEGLKGPNAQTATGPARALAEQVRRLSIARNGLDASKLELDLAKPIRLIADNDTNSIVIASTPDNVVALAEVIAGLDTLPIGESVVVRIYPLDNASAVRTKAVIDQLFTQGEQLRRIPGTRRQGLPSTATGKALAGEIAVAVDERTNALIVAGREEAIALVEVLVKDLDSDRASNWVEPAVVQLKFADASTIADKLREVLVRGMATTPEAMGLQRQFGRLRMIQGGQVASFKPEDARPEQAKPADPAAPAQPPAGNKPAPPAVVAADLFAPVTGLVITPDETLNALIVVGTPANIAVVRELVSLLDVEAASAQNTVHVYPLKFAAAERVASVVQDIFRQRERSGPTRPEDRVVISADTRTNALLVSTSNRSFAIIEGLLKQLDAEEANYSVGLHILPVSGATVTQLAPKIERLMRERLEAATRSGAVRNPLDAFSIEAEPINNLLIIAASDENLGVIKELVSALSKDANLLNAQQRTEMIQLTQGSPVDITGQIKSLYLDKQNAVRGNNAVNVVPNERLNAILVTGTDADITEIRSLVTRLETAQIQTVRDVRRIELKSANSIEVVNLIENVLAGRPLGGRAVAGKQATKIRFLKDQVAGDIKNTTGRTATEADVDGFIREQVTLTPDIRTNSVMVAAPPQMLKLISELIADIDNSNAGLRKIEYVPAQERRRPRRWPSCSATSSTSASRATATSWSPPRAPTTPRRRPAPGAPDAPAPDSGLPGVGTTVTAVPDERQQLSIAIDARTNTLLVSGTAEYLNLVRKVVNDLDGRGQRPRPGCLPPPQRQGQGDRNYPRGVLPRRGHPRTFHPRP
jgi:type II secretory pathway component GspD/PulD (secretin)